MQVQRMKGGRLGGSGTRWPNCENKHATHASVHVTHTVKLVRLTLMLACVFGRRGARNTLFFAFFQIG